MKMDDFNGHIGRHIDGLHAAHVVHDIGQRNLEGRMLVESCLEMELCVMYVV